MNSLKQIQNNLVLYRRRMGFTQKQVARLLGHRDTSMISHYEHGRALPPLAMALGLEIIYRVPAGFLFPKMYDELKTKIRAKEERTATGQQSLFQALTPSAHEASSR
jgi:transcriptional regulator with XRE-family HTH domain